MAKKVRDTALPFHIGPFTHKHEMGLGIGAIAFHMLDQGVQGIGLQTLTRELVPKLALMVHGLAADFAADLDEQSQTMSCPPDNLKYQRSPSHPDSAHWPGPRW